MSVIVRNPHSVLAALQSRPQDILSLNLTPHLAESDAAWGRVSKLAREHGVQVSVQRPQRERGHSKNHEEGGRIGVAEAVLEEREPVSLQELFSEARERNDGKGLWLALDCLQDPHNVGAIFRTAAFFRVQGILMTQERSAPLTGTVYDIASGGVESVPFSLQVNLRQAFEAAKEEGLWILGTSEHASQDLVSIERDRPWLVVLGNEEKGMRRLTEENCDVLCGIQPKGKVVTSLNVSVAAGVVISRLA